MESLTGLLRAVRADGAVLRQSFLAPPWSLANVDTPPLTLYAVLRGNAWLATEGDRAAWLTAGEVALVRGPGPHRIADSPDTPPQVVIRRAVHCTSTTSGAPPRPAGGALTLVTGAYRTVDDVGRRLLGALPELIVEPAAPDPLSALLTEELAAEGAGRQLVLDRLLDLLLVRTLHAWFERPDTEPPRWYHALSDPAAGPALRAMHADPGRAWTVDALAAEALVSRANLARRFTALVGEAPMAYLTRWRMALAAELLREPGATVASVARAVGYTNSFAFSTAFKRAHGTSPGLLTRAHGVRSSP
ncbi:AraC family transcriptional regulator [Nonomuraea insulae]|uniref:AraC family transcriptional regulator n=1 Tax=Nonomuraea insulae TaxID=1616787 RepID=A0ABW1CL58_9ACTN